MNKRAAKNKNYSPPTSTYTSYHNLLPPHAHTHTHLVYVHAGIGEEELNVATSSFAALEQ
jgi:hypothetical protein